MSGGKMNKRKLLLPFIVIVSSYNLLSSSLSLSPSSVMSCDDYAVEHAVSTYVSNTLRSEISATEQMVRNQMNSMRDGTKEGDFWANAGNALLKFTGVTNDSISASMTNFQVKDIGMANGIRRCRALIGIGVRNQWISDSATITLIVEIGNKGVINVNEVKM